MIGIHWDLVLGVAVASIVPAVGLAIGLSFAAKAAHAAPHLAGLPDHLSLPAVVALPVAFFLPPLGILIGSIALWHVRSKALQGWHLAIAALWVGSAGCWALLLAFTIWKVSLA